MTIQILGQTEGRERAAAKDLAARLANTVRPQDNLTIVAGAKCYGQKHQDIDLLIFGDFAKGLQIKKELLPKAFASHRTYLSGFLLALEVKDHDPANARIMGNQVEVKYQDRWSNASEQSYQQIYSIRDYLIRAVEHAPWIFSGLWLRNISSTKFPNAPHNILGSDLDADRFIRFIVQNRHDALNHQVQKGHTDLSIAAFKKTEANVFRCALDLFTTKLSEGSLDRRKLELICQKILKEQQYADRLGNQLLLFRGRGGAGKTLRLLQIARTLYETSGDRILFLTYNKALVSDVRRLLAILGVSDKVDEQTIGIRSSDSFFFGLLKAYGLSPTQGSPDVFPVDYQQKKVELLNLLRLSKPADIIKEQTAINNPEIFAWDFVLVDEGQDWPEEERDLLFALFGSDRLIVADGVDQFVRNQKRCDWMKGVSARQIVTLKKSLRLKKNLCQIATAFAEKVGVEWDMEPNDDIHGGHVKLLLGPYARDAHTKIMESHNKAGNKPIDALFCMTGAVGARSARFPEELASWGFKVWDGTTSEGREHFATDVEQHRIVKYESCRGLEGWTVVCLDFDQFFDRQVIEGQSHERELFVSAEEAGLRFAARWSLIPLTRAIDTLVIQLEEHSALGQQLLSVASAYKDFVEIIRTHQ